MITIRSPSWVCSPLPQTRWQCDPTPRMLMPLAVPQDPQRRNSLAKREKATL